MILSPASSAVHAVGLILVFGLGSIVGMVLTGLLVCMPLLASPSSPRLLAAAQGAASLGSIGLGMLMMSRAGGALF